jgi:PAS domain S-box-containing protein
MSWREPMERELRIIMLEDNPADAELAGYELRKGGLNFVSRRVESEEDFTRELTSFGPDVILLDYELPSFDGSVALAIARSVAPGTPAIFVTGVLGEELAIDKLHEGATDYVLKDNLSRMVPAVRRALAEVEERTRRREAEEALREQYSTLKGIIESSDSPIFSVDTGYRYTSFNRSHAVVMKSLYDVDIEPGKSLLGYMTVEENREEAKRNIDRALRGDRVVEAAYSGEERLSLLYFEVVHNPIMNADGQVVGVAVFARDITGSKRA